MKKIKILSLLSFVFAFSAFAFASCGEDCQHPNLSLIQAPTKSSGGIIHCLECNGGDARTELPPLNDTDYTVEVVDADTSIYTFEKLGQSFEFFSSNFEIEVDGIWKDDGTLEAKGYKVKGYNGRNTSVTIPDEYNDGYYGRMPVIAIKGSAFENCTSLKSVTIPESVECIEMRAFYNCSSLETVNIPNSVTAIQSNAFENCSSLKTIVIPNSVTLIGSQVFKGCNSLNSLTLPFFDDGWANGLSGLFGGNYQYGEATVPDTLKEVTVAGGESLPYGAFQGCGFIENIYLADTITNVEDSAFLRCASLKNISIPKSVKRIGNYAFAGCNGLTTIYYEGTKEDWVAMEISDQQGTGPDLLKTVCYYVEEKPETIELIKGNKSWHYDESNTPALWTYQQTNSVDGKTYTHYETKVTVSDEYWYMLESAKQQGMLDEVFADEAQKLMYTSSVSKEDYEAKLANASAEGYFGYTVSFADGKATISQGEQTSYPLDYVEVDNSEIYFTLSEVLAFKVDAESGKIYEEVVNEYITVNHTFLVSSAE